MRYLVRSLEGKRWLANEGGIFSFDSVEDAKMAGIGAGMSFAVVEGDGLRREVVFGLSAASGFIFSEGASVEGGASLGMMVAGVTTAAGKGVQAAVAR